MIKQKKHIIITKDENRCGKITEILSPADFRISYFPTIKILPVDEKSEIQNILQNLKDYSYLIFPSANSVEYFLRYGGKEALDNCEITVTAIGSKTKYYCERNGIGVQIVPENYSAKDLLNHFAGVDLRGRKILIPASNIARTELFDGLTKLGATVDQIVFYRNVKPPHDTLEIDNVLNEKADIYAFTSPSSFRNFLELLEIDSPKNYFEDKIIAAIGDTTKAAIEDREVEVQIIPEKFTVEAMAKAIRDYVLN